MAAHPRVSGDGPVRQLSVEDAEAYAGPGFLWLHLHGRDETDAAVLKRQIHLPGVAAGALFATETRPRCDRIEDGAIVNLQVQFFIEASGGSVTSALPDLVEEIRNFDAEA